MHAALRDTPLPIFVALGVVFPVLIWESTRS